MEVAAKDGLRIRGKITIDTYLAGMVELVAPYLEQIKLYKKLVEKEHPRSVVALHARDRIHYLTRKVDDLKAKLHLQTAVECPNLIMDSPGYGLDIIIQRLVGINTYSLNILYGEIGTGNTAPALSDTGLTAPTNRAAVGFQQDYGQTDAVLQFFFSDSQLANQTYYEFGTFVDGTTTTGSGQIFNHALLSPNYEKAAGTDTTVNLDVALTNG